MAFFKKYFRFVRKISCDTFSLFLFHYINFLDILCNRFGIEETSKEIGKRISRWLIGAPDREGGRKIRETAASHE